MSFFDSLNQILNSNPFKAIFPVQGLAQGATKAVTGINPAQQYAMGAGVGTGIAGLGALMGGGAGMTPYMPMSPSNMGMAGSTLGPGGLGSPLNPMSAAMPSQASSISKVMSLMRMLPQSNQQSQQPNPAMQRQEQERRLAMVYNMFPSLRPGSQLGQQGRF